MNLQGRKLILFELNEIPACVLARHAALNPRSCTSEILRRGHYHATRAEDEGELSPWVTWPTVHRGVTNRRHGISHLGQDTSAADRLYPPLWQLLAAGGRRVGMFGSLHSAPLPADRGNYAFFVPDCFAPDERAHPEKLEAFQAFNLAMVDGNGRNVSAGFMSKPTARFLAAAPALGLRPATCVRIARQLVEERIEPRRIVRRRTIQSLLSFDVFRSLLERTRPDCAFYFSNHVASAMHRYWPATFPHDYADKWWDHEWQLAFGGEIDHAMKAADRMLRWLVDFTGRHREYVLIVLGSMGQAASPYNDRRIGTQLLLKDPEKLLSALGVTDWARRRSMEPIYTFQLPPHEQPSLYEGLQRTCVNGEALRPRWDDGGTVSVKFGHPNLTDEQTTVTIGDRAHRPDELGLANVAIQDEVGSATDHAPNGVMIIVDPQVDQGSAGPELSTVEIAPAILRNFGIAPPSYM
ncbi:MAG: hypothetical protein M3177_07335 [Pseudomonadota bacterium]|nr:hypothetical protein [Pseudomonadota bacterium]